MALWLITLFCIYILIVAKSLSGIANDSEKTAIPLIPMGKLIQPEDIAETILFLASEQVRMITGQVIKVSGDHTL